MGRPRHLWAWARWCSPLVEVLNPTANAIISAHRCLLTHMSRSFEIPDFQLFIHTGLQPWIPPERSRSGSAFLHALYSPSTPQKPPRELGSQLFLLMSDLFQIGTVGRGHHDERSRQNFEVSRPEATPVERLESKGRNRLQIFWSAQMWATSRP